MINQDWIEFIEPKDLNENYPIALTYKATENVQPIIYIKNKDEFDKITLKLDEEKIEYDFITLNQLRSLSATIKIGEKLND